MTTELTTALTQLNFDPREQAIYLALLKLGTASVQEIAETASVERTGIYAILERFIAQGLVTETIVGKKRRFVAQDPKRLTELLREKQAALTEILPELQAIWTASDVRPRVRYYQGTEGMRSVIEDTIAGPKQELLGILSAEDLFATLGERWMENYTKQRVKQGFSLRVVRSEQKEVGERWPTSTKERRELRYAPPAMIFSMTMYIYGNKVAMLSTRHENFGMIIESDEFATHQRNLFEALWQVSREQRGTNKK